MHKAVKSTELVNVSSLRRIPSEYFLTLDDLHQPTYRPKSAFTTPKKSQHLNKLVFLIKLYVILPVMVETCIDCSVSVLIFED